jgi:hypothetical protein
LAEKDPKSTWPVPILLLVTLAGGYLFTQSPLKSFRPFHESLNTPLSNTEQEVPTRLWQDPIEAVFKYRSKAQSPPIGIGIAQMRTEIDHVIKKASGDDTGKPPSAKLTVLIATLDDSPYSEGRETRIRVRYAVGAALDHVCYVPESAESLGLMSWPAKKLDSEGTIVKDNNVEKTVALEVPFEWYRKRRVVTCTNATNADQYPAKVLVLWVKSSDIERAPLHYLSQLVTSLVPEPLNKPSSVSIKLLGPSGSDALRGMIRSAMNRDKPFDWSRSHVEVLSAWATVDPLLLLASENPSELTTAPPRPSAQSSRRKIASYFNQAGIDWAYSVGSDRSIMAQLGEELQNRNVDIKKAKIAVISEWDTFYGRMLPLQFRAMVLCAHWGNTFCSSDDEWRASLKYSQNPDEINIDVHHYTYLRGLDGEMAHQERPSPSKQKSQQNSIYEAWKDEEAVSSLERPDGPSQYDYVRRLSAQLKKGESTESAYAAIGVLGSDAHDKLLILQALRNEFPDAIFFSTDLDARFLHPSQRSWTRNLIIASPFGLRLDDSEQRDIPPFRDSYQSAVYHALITSLTIKSDTARQEPIPQGCLEPKCVRLFEVGRTQFVNLSLGFPAPHPKEGEHLGRGPLNPATILGKTFLGIFLACVLMWTLWTSKKAALFIGAVGIAALICLALCWHWASDLQQEPFFWAEGVSIWPTELVRVLAVAITMYFIVTILRSLRHHKTDIAEKYVKDSNNLEDQFDFPKLWKKHDSETRGCILGSKIVLGVGLSLVLAWLIFESLGLPFIPVRGTIGRNVDRWVLSSSVLFLYILLILVAYLCIACSTLLDDLRTHRAGPLTGWGEDDLSTSLPRAILNNVFAIRVSADYTTLFASFAPYPLYVLFLMIVARNGYFDRWTFPPSLILAYFVMFGLLAFSSMKLWSHGRKLRGEVLASLQQHLATAQWQRDTVLAANIEKVIDEVANLKKGVYGTWHNQPVWSTILYPLGGVTILSFLDFMAGK